MERKPRKRLKKLMVDICQQIEFYFSDANLRNDRFLQNEMSKSEERYISLNTIANFNKIKNMTTDRKAVVTAIQQSSLLELSKDETMVRRKVPMRPPKHDPDDCMVYVECLPKKADHDWLKRAFSHCGSVVYISLPRYKSSNDIKGFAFIEFENPQEANRACELMNNPPQDARSRAGRFPTMRGRKRIVPVELDSSLKHKESRASRDRQQGELEDQSARRKAINLKKIQGESEEVTGKHEGLEKQKRKRKLDDASGNDGSCSKFSKPAVENFQELTEEKYREHGDTRDEMKESAHLRKTRKRRHADDGKEDVSKSANRTSSLGEKEKNENIPKREDTKRKEEMEEDCENSKEESFEHRRLRIIQMGRKMIKRKRSLSEGDKWEVRFRDEEEDETAYRGSEVGPDDGTENPKKRRMDSSEDARDRDGQESAADVSHASSVDKRKRNRKKKLTRRMQEEEDALFLRVISKKEWLELRQEYLDLQKECLAHMKNSLRNQVKQENNLEPAVRKEKIPVASTGVKLEASRKDDIGGPEFVKGTVLRLKCLTTTLTRKDIKEQLENISPVAYIDLPDGEVQGHVRFQTANGSEMVLSKDMAEYQISLSAISDAEEEAYWEKLRLDRENKLKSKHTNKKKRGVNKILQKAERAHAEKAKTHIHFD